MADSQITATGGVYQCRKCEILRNADDFYVSNKTECKECVKRRVRDRARNNPNVQLYDRERAKTPERRAKAQAIMRKWRAENDLGRKAHSRVSHALRSGKLTKLPCLFCGAEEVHAHHRDYSKPLEVIWLCAKCHHRLHANFPETEGQNKRVSRE